MSAPAPKGYQREAVANALEIFRYAESQFRQASDDASRAAATAFNGCLLLEAPTGSGKTLMAGMIAETLAAPDRDSNARIVWFWFTPFAGLVEQTKGAIKSTFAGLCVRDLQCDRKTRGTRSGDLFVSTWSSVAASNATTRKVRSGGEFVLALDDLIAELRADGFRIGAVVDEAHHGFARATEAVRFYRESLKPDFTLLVTSTPDEQDVEKFKKATGIEHLHRIRVSRMEAVDAGLIKDGIKSIAYLAADDQKELIDFGMTALADGWGMHNAIKQGLQAAGIGLVPLMLVQVGNNNSAVAEARTRLASLGVQESKIAWYTADDPNDDLLAVAIDEKKEVLIFKVAVALGFDAPRAFTLVSMRGAKDTDFGIQVVGRILRVHGRLQGPTLEKKLPELLRCGYVFLADSANQSGMVHAGEKINAIQSELSHVCPFTMVVKVAGTNEIQVSHNGQAQLLSHPYSPPVWPTPAPGEYIAADGGPVASVTPAWGTTGILTNLMLMPSEAAPQRVVAIEAPRTVSLLSGTRHFFIRDGVPRVYRSEQLPLSTSDLLTCISANIAIDDKAFNAGFRQSVKVTRQTVDLFDGGEVTAAVQARLSDSEIVVYVDESGDHGMQNIDKDYPVFVLAFCVFHKKHYTRRVVPDIEDLKFKYFGHDLIVLHENEIRRQTGAFTQFTNRKLRSHFMSDLTGVIESSNFILISCVIDKIALKATLKGKVSNTLNPYHIALGFCLETLFDFLCEKGQQHRLTHVIVERRGSKEDDELELEFRRMCDGATKLRAPLPFDIIFGDKKVNSTGLQLADLVARPIGMSLVKQGQNNRAFDALKRKFYCSGGRENVGAGFENWGLKIYPEPESEKPR